MTKLLIGGSPCTYWSIAQKKGRETEPSGLGWELFENYLIAIKKFNPDYFLYENNYSMSRAIREEITKRLGVEPIMINSSLVSAQNRKRLYWTNIPDVKQPEDRGIILKDVLESGATLRMKGYTLKANYTHASATSAMDGGYFQSTMKVEKVGTGKAVGYRNRREDDGKLHRRFEGGKSEKAHTLTTVKTDSMVAEPIRIGTIESGEKATSQDSQAIRVYSCFGKSVTQSSCGGGQGGKTGLYATPFDEGTTNDRPEIIYEIRNGKININGNEFPIKLEDGFYVIRKLTVLECKRLQTVPDSYIFPVSNTQAYKMLGNGWTVDVIAHILSFIPELRNMELKVLSMYDGMSCGRIALNKLGCNVREYYATEIDKYAIQTTQENFPDTVQLGDAFQVRKEDWKLEG